MRNRSRLVAPGALLFGVTLFGLHACHDTGADPVGVSRQGARAATGIAPAPITAATQAGTSASSREGAGLSALLPFNEWITTSGTAFTVSNNGSGAAGSFSSTSGVGIIATSNPGGSDAVRAVGVGGRAAGYFQALGTSRGIYAAADDSVTIDGYNNGSGKVLRLRNATGTTGRLAEIIAAGGGTGLYVNASGGGWAAQFYGGNGSRGVYVRTAFGTEGLQVVGGSKNAVVGTSTGARALYTEESAEVWFTDYGFSRLSNGRAHIAFDKTFLETISAERGYHVFVQPYGSAELYVVNRTSEGFDVRLRDGEPTVEFSFRIVAKRRGFEGKRLERAPWADGDVSKN